MDSLLIKQTSDTGGSGGTVTDSVSGGFHMSPDAVLSGMSAPPRKIQDWPASLPWNI